MTRKRIILILAICGLLVLMYFQGCLPFSPPRQKPARLEVKIIRKLLYWNLKSKNPEKRADSVSQLANNVDLGFHDIQPALDALKTDPSEAVRSRAALALGSAAITDTSETRLLILEALLESLMHDSDINVRRSAVASVETVLGLILSRDPAESRQKALSLTEPFLQKAKEHEDESVREYGERIADAIYYYRESQSISK